MRYSHLCSMLCLSIGISGMLPQAGAQEAKNDGKGSSNFVLQEVVVTAQRREESIQSVPIAVSAFSADELQKLGASNNADLNQIVPGLNIQDRGGIIQPMIRGVGTVASVVGDESAIAVYIDGAYSPTSWGGLFRFFDVQRVEVLRGPQGTLFGRNATGGLINIITRNPATDGLHGDLSVGYSRFNTIDVDGYLTGPLNNTLAASVAGYYSRSDGYLTNPNTPGKNIGENWNGGVRTKLTFSPNDDFTATLAVNYTYDRDPSGFWTTVASDSSPFANPSGPAPFITTSDTPYVSTSNFAEQRNSQTSVTLQTKATFAAFDFYSTASWRRVAYEAVNDGDSGPFQVVKLTFDNPSENESLDARLQSNGTGPFQWIAGLFAYHSKDGLENFNYRVGTFPFTAPDYATALLINKGEIGTDAYAAYGQASYDLSDHLTAIAGLRYSVEKKTLDAVAAGIPTQTDDKKFHNFSPKATLQYKFNPKAMVYLTYGEAFKSGAYNPLQIADPGHPEDAKIPVDPEKIRAYELGLKADLTERLRTNLQGFYYKYDNLQTTVDTGVVNILKNAAKATIKGAEVELLWSTPDLFGAQDKLTLSANVAYLNAIYDSYPNASINIPNGPFMGTSIVTRDASGNRMVRTPRWTENVGIDYRNVQSWGAIGLSTNAYFNSGFFQDEGNIPLYAQGSFKKINTSLSWTSVDEHHTITLWGKNITDAVIGRTPLLLGPFGVVNSWYPPATFGVTYDLKF